MILQLILCLHIYTKVYMAHLNFILGPRAAQRVALGYPWIFRSDVLNAKEAGSFEPGQICVFSNGHGKILATGYAHPNNQLMGRILAPGEAAVTQALFEQKFSAALQWREMCFDQPYYRLVHAESDGLPGLVIDRFGDTLVVQTNTAGMDALQDMWLPALQKIVPVKNIVFKNDGNTRSMEGLSESIEVIQGTVPADGRVALQENNTQFYADVLQGQKTGWFFDQRPHRAWLAAMAQDKSVLDVFCHTGGFGITAGVKGAREITCADSSAAAIALTTANAQLNGIADKVTTIEGKAFDVMESLKQSFDLVSVDPPAFVKTKKDLATGLKGYEKLARLAAPLVEQGGVLFYASCSSHPTEKDILDAVTLGCAKVKRQASLVYVGTAGPDHPMHPMLPETRYLKALGFRIT